jgi:hypothetical protein
MHGQQRVTMSSREFWTEFGIVVSGFVPAAIAIWVIFLFS